MYCYFTGDNLQREISKRGSNIDDKWCLRYTIFIPNLAITQQVHIIREFGGINCMGTNDMAQDRKIEPIDKVELTDILGGCEIDTLDDVNVSNEHKFTKLELTQEQKMQISGLMNQLPALLNVNSISKAVRLTFPKGVQGSLMALKRGGYSTTLVDKTGKIVGTASLNYPTFQTAALGAFTAMSVVSGQYFLAQINNKLGEMSSKLDEILEFLYSDKRAELLSEVNFIHFAYENYKSVMEHSEQRIATLVNLQSAKKVAMKNIEFYLSDLKSAIDNMYKKKSAMDKKNSWIAKKMIRTQECLEFSLQLYAMSNILEVYYSENFDPKYTRFVEDEATKYIGTCANNSHIYFGRLQQLLAGAKTPAQTEAANEVNDIVERMGRIITSPLLTELRSTLCETSKEKQYYLTRDGEVYLLKDS